VDLDVVGESGRQGCERPGQHECIGSSRIPYVPESAPSAPRYLVLDIVRLAQHPNLVADGSAGRLGVVVCIRGYDDGSFRYVVSNTEDTDNADVTGIYYEEMLTATGEVCAPEVFALAMDGSYSASGAKKSENTI
jgi:hypothetical protein